MLEAAAYICTYIEGNFLISALPGLDGAEIDWTASEIRIQQIITIACWILFLTLAVFFWKKLKSEQVLWWIRAGCIWFFLWMIITLIGSCFGKWDKVLYNRSHNYDVSSENMLQYSANQNFIILLLDHVDAREFSDLIEKYPDYKNIFSDFTYYTDMQGMYPYTLYAVPYILTGQRYENETEFNKYFEKAMSKSPLLNMLEERNYKIGIYYEQLKYTNQEAKNRLDNLSEHRSYVSSTWALDKVWLKLVGLRYLPYGLKKYSVLNQDAINDLRAKKDIEVPDDYNWRNYVFYDLLTNKGMELTDQNCFRYIHLKGSHKEYDIDENAQFSEEYTSLETVLKGCMTILKEYLRQLQELQVYDNSAVIIMADHGDNTVTAENPFFLVKGFGERHEKMQFSDAAVSFADLMEIDRALLEGKTGTAILPFDPGEDRTRLCLWYKAFNESEHMVEYQQTGKVGDEETFVPTGRVYDRKE
ncbi:MAG: sulfatase-like hydrolase/transferase [Lachnospiraceae bacterium]|nr:sulfatase-like hydrolase/transferase [Lachnospiraceae bacterium]